MRFFNLAVVRRRDVVQPCERASRGRADKFIIFIAIHVRCRHGSGFSIDVASRIFQTIAPKQNGASNNVVDVSDAAIKRYCSLGGGLRPHPCS